MINLTKEVVPTQTLVLCLGGTGAEVFRYLTKILANQPEETRSTIQPFLIDADGLPNGIESGRGHHYYYEDFSAFDSPLWEEFRQQRFPKNLGAKIIANTIKGAGAVRVFGNASLAACRDKIAELLQQAEKLAATPYRRVYIVAGGAGGTGSSMVIDVAAQVAKYFQQYQLIIPIGLVLTGPNIQYESYIEDTVRDRMRANHYALMKELNHYSSHPFVSPYRALDPILQINSIPGRQQLFEWAYYFNDHRPRYEMSWMIAEMLMHLGLSSVGGAMASLIPNESEKRDLRYPLDFSHPDHREHSNKGSARGVSGPPNDGEMPEVELASISAPRQSAISRPSFLAGCAIRTVRLPTGEIEQYLLAQTAREAIRVLHTGRIQSVRQEAVRLEYYGLLGIKAGGGVDATGLLAARWDLTPDSFMAGIEAAYRANPLVPAVNRVPHDANPDDSIQICRKFLADLNNIVGYIRDFQADRANADENPLQQFCNQLAQQATDRWASALDQGVVRQRLEMLAWHPSQPRGLEWLDGLASCISSYCEGQAKLSPTVPPLQQLLDDLEACGAQLATLQRQLQRERASWSGRSRAVWSLIRTGKASPYQAATVQKIGRLLSRQIGLRNEIEALVIQTIASQFQRHYFDQAAQAFRRYRHTVLQPLALSLDNAHDYAKRLEEKAFSELKCWQQSPTTLQVFDKELLKTAMAHFRQLYDGSGEIMHGLLEGGLLLGMEQLTIRNFTGFTTEQLYQIVHGHIESSSREQRRFLDQGWGFSGTRSLLMARIGWLEGAMQPSINYDRDGLGQRSVRGFLLVPEGLELPLPLGERLGNLPVMRSSDARCVTVISFIHGIALNALRGLEGCYEPYRRRLGDNLDVVDRERFPLHIFRDGTYYDEPYSPVGWVLSDSGLRELLALAHMLKLTNDGQVKLPVRKFDATVDALRVDHNRVIELARTVLDKVRFTGQHTMVREKLLHTPGLLPLRQTYLAENGAPAMAAASG